jgi:hypothetical protein
MHERKFANSFIQHQAIVDAATVERRMTILDFAANNDYFNQSYGAFDYLGWGI